MLAYSNTATTGASQTVAPGAAYVNGNATGKFLFMPTAQDLTDTAGNFNYRLNTAERTASCVT